MGWQEGTAWHTASLSRGLRGRDVVLSKGLLSQSPSGIILWASRVLAWQDRTPHNVRLCTPKASHQAGQDVSRDEHVEDIVPARGRDEPGQQRPQSRTCGAQCQGRAPANGPWAPPRDSSRPRSVPQTRLSARLLGARSQPQTYGAGAVDDGRDGGQGLRVAFQALVCPLGTREQSEARTKRQHGAPGLKGR